MDNAHVDRDQQDSAKDEPEPEHLHDPSKIIFQTNTTRRSILASYWIVIFLALPIWWYTTSIERLSLPSSRVYAQAEKELLFPVTVQLEGFRDDQNLQGLLHERTWKALDITVRDLAGAGADVSNSPSTYTVKLGADEPIIHDRQLSLPTQYNEVSKLSDILASLLAPYHDEHRVVQYSPRLRLAFTLLNEDAAAGNSIIGWDIADSISHHISPILKSLSSLHNFTIESQVQFHAPLAFKPIPVPGSQDAHAHGITPEDLTVFINSAEWTLSSSVSNDPVLHFILFVPSVSQRPLYILDANGAPSPSNAFLLPQWGGIVLYNPPPDLTTQSHPHAQAHLTSTHLNSPFSSFSTQLLALLGVPPLPKDLHLLIPRAPNSDSDSGSPLITGWQLDALLRRRSMENARGSQETLRSIVKLVDQIENMPVGQDVRGDIQDALLALDNVYTLSTTSLPLTFQHSASALTLASRAFFNPGMLALLYFPAEHKYAVYTPLFASAVIPLVAAALRELVGFRKERKEKREALKKGSRERTDVVDDGSLRVKVD